MDVATGGGGLGRSKPVPGQEFGGVTSPNTRPAALGKVSSLRNEEHEKACVRDPSAGRYFRSQMAADGQRAMGNGCHGHGCDVRRSLSLVKILHSGLSVPSPTQGSRAS